MRYLAVFIGLTFAAFACGSSAEPTPVVTAFVPPPIVITPTPAPTPSEPEPTSVPSESLTVVLSDTGLFEDVSEKLDFVREGVYHSSDGFGGAAWFDYDGDLDLDLYITNAKDVDNALFRNDGDGTFTNVTEEAGVANGTGNAAVIAGDIDNNGCPDLLMSGDGGFFASKPSHFKVFTNNCDGTFSDATEDAGLDEVEGSWALALGDIDNDSYLDLFVGGLPGAGFDFGTHSKLYRNDGDGTFTDITKSSGIDNDLPSCGVGFSHHNEDGWIDIFISSCVWTDSRSLLWRNNGDLTFTDIGVDVGMAEVDDSGIGYVQNMRVGVTFADYDLDGDLDLVSNDDGVFGPIFEKQPDGTYEAFGHETELSRLLIGWAYNVADFNNDGTGDIFYSGGLDLGDITWPGNPGTVLLNNGDKTFQTSGTVGLDEAFSTGVAIGDFDNDGYPDILVVTTESRGEGGQPLLLHNKGGENNWVTIRLVGTVSNRDGFGAMVTVKTGDKSWVKLSPSGSGFLSSNSPWLTFGLGDHDGPVDVAVKWPSGLTEVFERQSIRQIITLTEGTGTAK